MPLDGPPELRQLPDEPDVIAPDGSAVRVLLAVPGGSMAHFELAPGAVSRAVVHRTVDEIWFVVSGHGWMRRWARRDPSGLPLPLVPGTCLSIPVGTVFQFGAEGDRPLQIVGATMPPWPGDGEAEVWPDPPVPPTVAPEP